MKCIRFKVIFLKKEKFSLCKRHVSNHWLRDELCLRVFISNFTYLRNTKCTEKNCLPVFFSFLHPIFVRTRLNWLPSIYLNVWLFLFYVLQEFKYVITYVRAAETRTYIPEARKIAYVYVCKFLFKVMWLHSSKPKCSNRFT